MTEQERSEYYANRQAYFEKCHNFKEELDQWFLNYKPRNKNNSIEIKNPESHDQRKVWST